MQKLSEIIRSQSVETRYTEKDGSMFRDIHPLEELPELIDRIEATGGKLIGVRRFEA